MHIPSVRAILEEAAAKQARNPEVYLALTKIYYEDIKRIEEAVRLQQKTAEATVVRRESPHAPAYRRRIGDRTCATTSTTSVTICSRYLISSLTPTASHGRTTRLSCCPRKSRVKIVLDVQVTDEGKVGGVWLVSAVPEIFESLAAAAVREWEFEPIVAKIRVILRFTP